MTQQTAQSENHEGTIVTLVVDDDQGMRRALKRYLESEGYSVFEASNGNEALDLLGNERVDVVLTDVKMPDLDGMDLLKASRKTIPDLPIVLMTAFGTVENAVAAMKAGASDYLRKPFELTEVLLVLSRAVESARMKREVEKLRAETGRPFSFDMLIGESQPMKDLKKQIQKIASSDANVIICGESGTGKELVAQAVHHYGSRSKKPLVAVNCSAVPETLFESEFFGFMKGAFTGAIQSRAGLFEEADGGTLFLDEISTLPESCQAKLLRVLEEGKVKRVGALKAHPIDVRIICATNILLEDAVESGAFRTDLFYRLNVVTISIPPLRMRREDIRSLFDHFLKLHLPAGEDIPVVSDKIMELLVRHDWPGNVRELQNAVQRSLVLYDGGELSVRDLPEQLMNLNSSLYGGDEKKDIHIDGSVNAGSSSMEYEQVVPSLEEVLRLDELERLHIAKIVEMTGGNRTKAAEILGINRRTLYRKLKLDEPEE